MARHPAIERTQRCIHQDPSGTCCTERTTGSHRWDDGLWTIGARCKAHARAKAEREDHARRMEVALLRRYAHQRHVKAAEVYADRLAWEREVCLATPPGQWPAAVLCDHRVLFAEVGWSLDHYRAFNRWCQGLGVQRAPGIVSIVGRITRRALVPRAVAA